MAWLGPRGLASILFAGIVQDAQLGNTSTIIAAACVTPGVSVLLYRLSAAALVNRSVDRYQRHSDDRTPSMESKPAADFRVHGPVPHYALPRQVLESRMKQALDAEGLARRLA